MTASQIDKMVRFIVKTHKEDITCDECYEHIDRYVDLIDSGAPLDQVLISVQRHIENCPCCFHELEALQAILKGQEETESDV